jgi:hypothetical protein
MTEFIFASTREKRSIIFYCVMKLAWGSEKYIVCWARNDRSGLARFKSDIWKLRGKEEGAVHILLLLCSDTRKWKGQFWTKNCLIGNENVVYKKIIICANVSELRNIGRCLYQLDVSGRILRVKRGGSVQLQYKNKYCVVGE